MSVLLCLGSVQLLLALGGEILAKGIGDILLGEEYVYACEVGIVWSHAVILQAGYCSHSLLGHVLLCEHLCELLCAVVAVVDEYYHVALADSAVDGRVADSLYELVGNALVVAFLHGLYHVGRLLSLTLYEQVVGFLYSVPALVAVHGIEASDDACYMCSVLIAAFLYILDKSLAALRVGVASVHEAVYEHLVKTIFLAYLDELEEVVE